MCAFLVAGSKLFGYGNHLRLQRRSVGNAISTQRPNWICSQSHIRRGSSITSSTRTNQSIWQALKTAPSEPGIYRFLNANGDVLYIGKARRLSTRLRQYIARDDYAVSGVKPSSSVGPRIATMVRESTSVDFIVTQSEAAALALEASMVSELKPKYNVLLKDDRRHPYAMITFSEEYPRIFVTRSRKRKNLEDRLYGPFVDEGRLRQVLDCIHAVFPLRQRPRRLFSDRPCINFDLGRCPAPCQKLVSVEDYSKTISKVDKLLKGRVVEVLDDMRRDMCTHSTAMEYEKAAVVRDRIATIENIFFDGAFSESQHSQNLPQSFTDNAEAAASIVNLDPFISRDVFGIAHSENIGKVVLFQVRGGKVIGRLIFTVEGCTDTSLAGDLLGAVLSSHYASSSHPMEIPEEVVVDRAMLDSNLLRAALSEKRGKAVSIRQPGPNTASIVQMVQHNAAIEVSLEDQRASDTARQVSSLYELISPYLNDIVIRKYDHANLDEKMAASNNSAPGIAEPTVELGNLSCLNRIEGYDISHTSGSNAVGAQVVFLNGASAPSEYRRYNLTEFSSSRGAPDDFESIRETLRRRFKGHDDEDIRNSMNASTLPDLLIIDGGKGQLSAAIEVLQELDLESVVPIISIAKQNEAVFVPNRSAAINYEESGDYLMNDGIRLICRVRDEAHRCAVSAHRKRRGRQELRSGLDAIHGLGRMKRAVLLEHFSGSSEGIAKASKSELEKVPGIGPALALRVFEYFHS